MTPVSLDTYVRILLATTALAAVVVLVGAYVRLSDAGLGCPDWPGCYGSIAVPLSETAVESANAAYPERPVEAPKAWKEMAHRYIAGLLGLLILALAVLAWQRRHMPGQRVVLPFALLALVIFQALLGMWTVTLLLKPAVVMAHLLGGMTTLALLWWFALRQGHLFSRATELSSVERLGLLRVLTAVGLGVVYLQLSLGGWTSANYAALACPDFPLCHGSWWPEGDSAGAFRLWTGTGVDYEGGVLSNEARITIHVVHRLGALVTFLYLTTLAALVIWRGQGRQGLVLAAVVLLVVLLAQVGLGIANVLMSLPLPVAVAHNGGAALLLLTVVTLLHLLHPPRPAM